MNNITTATYEIPSDDSSIPTDLSTRSVAFPSELEVAVNYDILGDNATNEGPIIKELKGSTMPPSTKESEKIVVQADIHANQESKPVVRKPEGVHVPPPDQVVRDPEEVTIPPPLDVPSNAITQAKLVPMSEPEPVTSVKTPKGVTIQLTPPIPAPRFQKIDGKLLKSNQDKKQAENVHKTKNDNPAPREKVVNNIKNAAKDYAHVVKCKVQNISKKDRKSFDKTFDSHPNQSKNPENKEKYNNRKEFFSTINSESDWETDGPIQLAPNPFDKDCQVRPELPKVGSPQRYWEKEIIGNQPHSNHIVNTIPSRPYMQIHNPRQDGPGRTTPERSEQRPKTVRELSYQVVATGKNGEVSVEDKSVLHDNFEVYRSTAYKKKMKKLEKFKNIPKPIKPAKVPVKTRFVLTNVDPETENEDIEYHILSNFDDVDEVYIRKNDQKRDTNYVSFVIIINSEYELNIRAFEQHRWGGHMRCFFAPHPK